MGCRLQRGGPRRDAAERVWAGSALAPWGLAATPREPLAQPSGWAQAMAGLLPGGQHWLSTAPPGTARWRSWPHACHCDLQRSPLPWQGQTQARSVMAVEGMGKPRGWPRSPRAEPPPRSPPPHRESSACCSATSSGPTTPGPPSPALTTTSRHRPPQQPLGSSPQGTRPQQGQGRRVQGAGGVGMGLYLSRGGRGTEPWQGAVGAGAHPASSRTTLGRGSSGSGGGRNHSPSCSRLHHGPSRAAWSH